MKTFKEWWNDAEIFAGEGSMDAAEQTWDYVEEQIPQWISVKDKLPETDETNYSDPMLVYLGNNEMDIAFYSKHSGEWEGAYHIYSMSVSHWMLLPDIPETK